MSDCRYHRFVLKRRMKLMMGDSTQSGLTYADAGVDIDAGNEMVRRIKPLVRETRRPGAAAEIGGFGGLFDLKAAGFKDPILVAANDGVGSKVKIAIETGRHTTIGIDLVAMCVNDLIVQGAEPLFFLDYFASGRLDTDVGVAIVEGIAKGCREAGAALIGGETAEMPGLYAGKDYDLAGFSVGAVERDAVLPRGVSPGDLILGLPSSGVHSNGFSLVRRIVSDAGLAWDHDAPFALGLSLGEALLEPTRIYVKPILACSARARRHQSAGPHHRRRISREYPTCSTGRLHGCDRSRGGSCSARYSGGWRERAAWRRRKWRGHSIAVSG